jgi:hypothetical protein
MNALPIKQNHSPHDVIDTLIADFGVKPVLLALAARLFRRRPVTPAAHFPGLEHQPGIDHLGDHLRADLGLPPKADTAPLVDPIVLLRRGYF